MLFAEGTIDLQLAEDVSEWIEVVAIVVIALGVLVATVGGVRAAFRAGGDAGFDAFKHLLTRGILIGLDLLIAADIIRTVTIAPTVENVAALGLLVIVRTIVAWTLILESEGRWPWQPAPEPAD